MEITDEKDTPNPDYAPAKYRIVGIGDLAFVFSLVEINAKRFKIKVQIESASELYPRKYSYVIEEL